MMARAYILCLCVIFFLGGCKTSVSGQNSDKIGDTLSETDVKQAEPEDPFLWDFGNVKQEEIVSHDFRLKNTSNRTMHIKGSQTSCGCTISEIQKDTLAPSESTVIKIQFKTKGYKGSVEQFVFVNTDDKKNPVFKFTIKANVQ